MHCENRFCIYWAADGCRLDGITLDMQGKCEQCLYVDIDEDTLQQERTRLLRQYHEPI